MRGAETFFDTNVVLSADAAKADRAEALLAEGGIVSVQVLNCQNIRTGWEQGLRLLTLKKLSAKYT